MLENTKHFKLPLDELVITTSRSGGPGGQHVNKSDTKVTVRWNLFATTVLTDTEKERAAKALAASLTANGDLLVSASQSRSQLENKKMALFLLEQKVEKALVVEKKRKATRASRASKEKRLQSKKAHSSIKKLRKNKSDFE
jgi:ribosome-associated protein